MMKAAISADASEVSPHFGRCAHYEIVEIDDGRIVGRETLANPGHAPGALPRLLKEHGVSVVVAGGMGPRAQQIFEQFGIQTITGVSGSIDRVAEALAAGTLKGGEDLCDHR